MSSSNKILSTQLCTGIADWFKANTYFNNTFKSIEDYLRVDFPVSEMPGISVYFNKSPSTMQNLWYEIGTVGIDVVFSLKENRSERAKELITILEMIKAQIYNNPLYIQQFVAKNYVPGLIRLTTKTAFNNISELKQKMLNSKNGSIVITFIMEYQISILKNQKAMWDAGYAYFSPEVPYYTEAVVEVDLEINPFKGNENE